EAAMVGVKVVSFKWIFFTIAVMTSLKFPMTLAQARWRDDERCGSKNDPNGNHIRFLAPNGRAAECDPRSAKPCCSAWGYCGSGADSAGVQYCSCPTCTDHRRAARPGSIVFRPPVPPRTPSGTAKWRSDERCGSKNDPTGNPLQFL
ncbi:unnamed protein product, partial [Meganyctiphanes norvegica]